MGYEVSTDKREPETLAVKQRKKSSNQTLIMIRLTRLNGSSIALNSDLIKFVENAPDTVITLINGEKMIVRESTEELIRKLVEFRRSVLAGLPTAGTDQNAAIALSAPKPSISENRSAEGPRRG
jgi:flagellar protein FlbD